MNLTVLIDYIRDIKRFAMLRKQYLVIKNPIIVFENVAEIV